MPSTQLKSSLKDGTYICMINIAKSKIMIFNKSGKCLKKFKFYINKQVLDCVPSYTYLGIKLSTSGKLHRAQDDLRYRALQALFKLKQDLFLETTIPIKLHLKLFDAVVKPILLYCSEVWSHENINQSQNLMKLSTPMEKLHIKFCKFLLNVNCKASNTACLMELGRYPLLVSGLTQMFKYWLKISQKAENTLTK